MPSLKTTIIRGGLEALYFSGANVLMRPFVSGVGAILTLHHVRPQRPDGFQPNRLLEVTPEFLERVLRFLRRQQLDIVSLDEVYRRLVEADFSRRFVCITIDDGYRDTLQYAYPILTKHGFTATLFVYTDYVGAGRNSLSWPELRELAAEGFDIQAHSKTHGDLRRTIGETDAQFARRMQAELEVPRGLFQRNLGAPPTTLAYPYGAADEDVVRAVRETGYAAAFTVRREGNPSFVTPLRAHRSQIYSEMSLQDFIKNLEVRHEERLGEAQ